MNIDKITKYNRNNSERNEGMSEDILIDSEVEPVNMPYNGTGLINIDDLVPNDNINGKTYGKIPDRSDENIDEKTKLLQINFDGTHAENNVIEKKNDKIQEKRKKIKKIQELKIDDKLYMFNYYLFDLIYISINNDVRKKILLDDDEVMSYLLFKPSDTADIVSFDNKTYSKNETINENIKLIYNKNKKHGYNTRLQIIVKFLIYTFNNNNKENVLKTNEISEHTHKLFYFGEDVNVMDIIFDKIKNKYVTNSDNISSSGKSHIYIGIESISLYLFKSKTVVNCGYIELPKCIANKQACINIKNDDNFCFIYTYLYHKYNTFINNNPNKVSNYNFNYLQKEGVIIPTKVGAKVNGFDNIFVSDIDFTQGITEKDIRKFEKLNDISVNILYLEENTKKDYQGLLDYVPTGEINNNIDPEDPAYEDYMIDLKKEQLKLGSGRDKDNGYSYSPSPSFSKYTDRMNILILSDDKLTNKNVINNHCVYIKDISRLFHNKDNNKKYICQFCLNFYYTEKSADKCFKYHMDNDEDPCIEEYPEEGENILKFDSGFVKKTLKCPYYIVCDFEAFTTKKCFGNNCHKFKPCIFCVKNGKITDKLEVSEKHIPASYKLMLVDVNHLDKSISIMSKPEKDIKQFQLNFVNDIQKLKKITKENMVGVNIPLKYTEEHYKIKNETKNCNVCNCNLVGEVKHIDHDHLTGVFRQILCRKCNMNLNFEGWQLPVVIHNLKSYDSHFIVKALAYYKEFNKKLIEIKKDFDIIPLSSEKYLSIKFDDLQFIDSFQFMQSSLGLLGENLTCDQKFFTKKYYNSLNISDHINFDDFCNKGYFPYSWFDSYDKFFVTEFPPIEAFYNNLNKKHIKEHDYNFAKKVYDICGCKTFKDYHDIYLNLDVTILSDVWYNFQQFSLKTYGLDPNNFVSAPSLSWIACLKYTGITLELLTETQKEIYRMFEMSIRGGICMAFNRHLKANNNLQDQSVNLDDNWFAAYFDANNLYGFSMSRPLPTGNFNLFENLSVKQDNDLLQVIKNYDIDNNKTGYILDVDIHIPKDKHDYLNGYCPCPELKTPTEDIVSEFNKNAYNASHNGKFKSTKKLILDLSDKTNYIVHIDNLKFYLQLGCVITKINRYVSFDHSKWLEKYITYNTDMRKKAKNEFEKDFFKLMNNSCFGKTMENVKKRKNFKLFSDEKRISKNLASSLTKNVYVYDENLFGFNKMKTKVILDKPIYLGSCILDLSKLLMYKFVYEYLYPKYGRENVIIYYTDTDSLIITIKTKNLYKDMVDDSDKYDLSEYAKTHPIYEIVNEKFNNDEIAIEKFMEKNKKVIGKMKDEITNGIITEGFFLKSKCYYVKSTDIKKLEIKKNKGTNKCIVKDELKYNDYKDALKADFKLEKDNICIRSIDHDIFTLNQKKTCQTSLCDKVYLLDNGINSLSYGHKDIK